MKVFIWFSCYFLLALFQTAARESGVIIGAIPLILLYGLFFWIAKKLCEVWDERKAEKSISADHELPATEQPPEPEPESSPTIAAPASPAPATPKLRYCKLCGAPIDPVTRKCTDCRKQYFRLPHLNKKHLFIGVGTLVAVAVVILMACLVLRLSTAEAKVEELNAQAETLNAELANQKNLVEKYTKAASSYSSSLGSLQTKYDDLYKENIDLRTQNTSMSSKISFYDWAVVIVPDDGSKKYHKYGCSYLDMSDGFYAYNPENARYFGYKPCSHCCD